MDTDYQKEKKQEVEVFKFKRFEKDKCYEFALNTRTEGNYPNARYFTTNPLQFVGKHKGTNYHSYPWRDDYFITEIFDDNGKINEIPNMGRECFREVVCSRLQSLTYGNLSKSVIEKLSIPEFDLSQWTKSVMENKIKSRLGDHPNKTRDKHLGMSVEQVSPSIDSKLDKIPVLDSIPVLEMPLNKDSEMVKPVSFDVSNFKKRLSKFKLKKSKKNPDYLLGEDFARAVNFIESPSIAAAASSFCRPDDGECNIMYNSFPWHELHELPGDCDRAVELLDQLIRLKDLLIQEEKPLGLTQIWIDKLKMRITKCSV